MKARRTANRLCFVLCASLWLSLTACTPDQRAPAALTSAEPVFLPFGKDFAVVGRSLTYLLDPDRTFTLSQIQARRSELPFRQNQGQYVSLGFRDGAVWFELVVRAQDADPRRLLLEVRNATLREVHFHLVRAGRPTQEHRASFVDPAARRVFEHRYHLFPLDLDPGETATVYLKASSSESLSIPILLWDRVDYFRRETGRNFMYGIFFGLMLVMAIYNLFIFLSVRDRAYLYYVLYICLLATLLSLVSGYSHFFFHDLTVLVHRWIGPMSALLASLAALAFARRFLLLREELPSAYRLLTAFMVLHAVVIAILPWLPSYYPGLFGNSVPLLAITAMLPIAYLRARRGFRPAHYFLIAWSFIIVGAFVFILQNLGLVRANFFTNNSLLIGASAEAMLLSFALGFRINELTRSEQEARQAALREQQRALEQELRMSEAFARFVPREFLNHLGRSSVLEIAQGDAVQRRMCVLFTDIRGFTGLSEKLGSEAIFRLLNDYLARMAPIIQKRGGFIDKFIGDAIMALFQDAAAGVHAAVDMARAMDELSREGRVPSGLRTGYGLHYGELMLGTVGSPERLDTTVIGDTVNLASRIESVTKQYGVRIIASDTVIRALGEGGPPSRELDTVFVRGKEKPVVLFEVYAAEPEDELAARENSASLFLGGLAYFRSGEFALARERFTQYGSACPFDPVPRLYLERIEKLQSMSSARQGWTGIYETW